MAQTDERAASSDKVRITMVEAKYFAVTEKYECRLVEVIDKKFRFVMELPHGAWQHIIIDGTHMVDDFAAVANGFDKNAWVDQWVQVSKEYSDVPDRTGLEEDATYHQETLKKNRKRARGSRKTARHRSCYNKLFRILWLQCRFALFVI